MMKSPRFCSFVPKLVTASMAVALWATASISATAADFVFDLTRYSNGQDIAFVQVTVHQQDVDTLRFTVDQPDPVFFGDLRGLFFHINESIIDPADLVFDNFMAYSNAAGNPLLAPDPNFLVDFDLNNVNSVNIQGGGNNINPIPALDIGIEFGTNGANPDDIHHVSFDISKVGGLDQMTFMPINMDNFIAARVMSLRPNDGSSKLTCCGTTVPEPSSTLGLLAFAIGGLLWRRRLAS